MQTTSHVDGLLQVINNNRTEAISKKQEQLTSVSSRQESLGQEITEIKSGNPTQSPFFKTKKQNILEGLEESLDQENDQNKEVEEVLLSLQKSIEEVEETTQLLQQLGIEHPRVISRDDFEYLMRLGIAYFDLNPCFDSPGVLSYAVDSYHVRKYQENKKKNPLLPHLYPSAEGRFKVELPEAPQYMVDENLQFLAVAEYQEADVFFEKKEFLEILDQETLNSKCRYRKGIFGRYRIQQEGDTLKCYCKQHKNHNWNHKQIKTHYGLPDITPDQRKRFYVGIIYDFSILESQITEDQMRKTLEDDPIHILIDALTGAVHIGSHYGGPSLLGEKKVLDLVGQMYLEM